MAKRVQEVDASAAEVFDRFETEVEAESGPRRWGMLAFVGVIAVALIVGAFLFLRNSSDGELDRANADYAVAVGALDAAADELRTAVDAAQGVLDGSAGQVADDTVRPTLSDELTAANELLAQADVVDAENAFSAADSVRRATVKINALAASIDERKSSLVAATDAVRMAQENYQLEQATTALNTASTELTATIDADEQLYTNSAGKVADDSLRQDLRYALDSATTAVVDAKSASGLAGVQGAIASLTDAKKELDSAAQAVTTAQSSWQAEQDRAAQEQEQAEQDAQRQEQLDWLRGQQPWGDDPSTGGPFWKFQDPQGNVYCLYSNGEVSPC